MALEVATSQNLNEFASRLGERLAGQGGGSGDSNFVFVSSYVGKNLTSENDGTHLYLVVDSSISMADKSLRYCRKGRTHIRRKGLSYHDTGEGYNAHSTGWHQIWQLPLHSTKTPLIVPIIKNPTTPDFVLNGNAYYEITVDGYDSFMQYIEDGVESGYLDMNKEPVPVGKLLCKTGGVCLVRGGVQISNFATFRASYDSDNDVWSLGR